MHTIQTIASRFECHGSKKMGEKVVFFSLSLSPRQEIFTLDKYLKELRLPLKKLK